MRLRPRQMSNRAAQRLGAELRSQDDSMLDPIPTGVTEHSKARTDGVSSSDMLGGRILPLGSLVHVVKVHSPCRMIGSEFPWSVSPSTSTSEEPIMKSAWVALVLPPA